MKVSLGLVFIFLSCFANANNPYRMYLLSRAMAYQPRTTVIQATPKTTCAIPRYQIPKGNVFCRMEDKLTRATGIWIKVGVK